MAEATVDEPFLILNQTGYTTKKPRFYSRLLDYYPISLSK